MEPLGFVDPVVGSVTAPSSNDMRSKLVFRNSFDAVRRVSQNRLAPVIRMSGCTPDVSTVRVVPNGVGIEDENDQVS